MSEPIPPDTTPRLTIVERRARLKALVRPDETVTACRRQELATLIGVSPSTIYRDLQTLRVAQQPARRVDIPLYIPEPQIGDRDLLLLRMLGHLKCMRASWIRDLLYPDRAQRTANSRLSQLRRQSLLWHTQQRLAPQRRQRPDSGRPAPPPNQPAIYGLTATGDARLREAGTLPSRLLFPMHIRATRSEAPSPQRLEQDLRVISWCASILSAAVQCTRLDGAFAQVDAVVARRPGSDEVDVAADALVALRFARGPIRRPDTPLPWIDNPDTRLLYGDRDVRLFALHIDADWDDAAIGKLARAYYSLSLSRDNRRHYEHINPIPIILTTSPERAAQIASTWNWPWLDKERALIDERHTRTENLALITTYAYATDFRWGTLWGRSWLMREPGTMKEKPTKNLLDGLFTHQEWQHACPPPAAARS